MRLLAAVKARMHALELVSGFLLVGMGLLIFSDRLSLISVWLTTVFGNRPGRLTSCELRVSRASFERSLSLANPQLDTRCSAAVARSLL